MLKLLTRDNFKKLMRNPAHAVKKGTHKIMTQAAAACLGGYSFSPRNITFFLTYRCNLRCNVCGQWGTNGYVKKHLPAMVQDELEIDRLKSIIDEIAPHNPQITLCGGEVLLYEKWYEFLSHVKAKGLECVLTTNGTMLAENAQKLVEAGLDKVSLSLDGPEHIHNKARRTNDGFSRAVHGIKALNELKRINHKIKPTVEIGCTISDQNYRYLDDVVDIAEALEVSCLIFLHLCFLSDKEFGGQEALFRHLFQTESIHWAGYRYKPGDIDVDFLNEKLEIIKSQHRRMPVIIHPDFDKAEIRDYYANPAFRPVSYENLCLAPWTTVYVFPNGDVSPCSSFVAGNLRHESLKSIWNNQRFRNFRNELKRRRFFPVCPKCCEFYKH